jgi:flagellar motor protein MotB
MDFMKIRYIPSKIKIAALVVGGLLGIYAILGFYLLPVLAKSKLPILIQQQTGRKASVAKVQFDPFSFKLSLQGFELQEPDGHLFAGFDNFFVDINVLQSIGQTALVIDKISLSKPVLRIAKDKNGVFNFQDLLANKSQPKEDDSKIFPLNIVKLSIAEGKLDWEDAHFQNPEKETIYPLNLAIENFTTRTDSSGDFDLTLELSSGGKLDWRGNVNLNPVSSSGHIKLDNVKLSRIRALALQDLVPLDLQGYEVFEADYTADYVDNKFNIHVNRGQFELHDVEASTTQDKALVKMLKLAVQGIGFNLETHELTIDSVSVNDADFKTSMNAEGVFNYQTLLPVTTEEQRLVEPTQPTSWVIKVNNIALNHCGLSFEDRTLKKPVTMIAKPINFKLTNFSNKDGASLPFQFSAGFNQKGLIKLDGNTVIQPLSAQIIVDIKDIALENFQSYVDKFAKVDVIDGALAIDGKVQVSKSAQDELDIKFTGNTKIVDFLTRDQVKNKDLVKWENLTLSGIDLDLSKNQYNAGTLLIDKPYARVIIKQDKTVNFNDIVIGEKKSEKDKQQTRAVKTDKSELPDAQKPKFKLDKIQIVDGSSDFSDFSMILPFTAQIKSLDGGASDISSERKSTVKVDLKGNAYDLAPVDINGEISPYLGDYNVTVNFNGMPMPLISPYMVQFAGYKVEKGKMTLGLNYKVENKELTASNNILIDHFELGEKVENPNAVSLPLELAVALMKDSDGKIKMNVPITGSLEDPKFSISHIVTDALVNAISKVITSPFRALASLIGSEEDLSAISFPAGNAELNKQQIRKLDDLAKALKARPVLKLDIKGASYQEQDWPEISDDALYDQLKRMKAAEINKQGGKKTRPEYVVISDQDYRRLMEQLFVEKFPLMVEKPLLGKLRLIGSKADTDTDEFYAVAKQKLSAIIAPEQQRLKSLAAERAQAIARYIVQKGGIENDRVYILDTAIDPKREGNEIISFLSLKTD